jgi:hypothetical protein
MSDIVVDDAITKIHLEVFEGRPFIHCEVYKWGPSSYRHILNVLVAITRAVGGVVYAYPPTDKAIKFATTLGFVHNGELVECSDGSTHEVYVWGWN